MKEMKLEVTKYFTAMRQLLLAAQLIRRNKKQVANKNLTSDWKWIQIIQIQTEASATYF